MAPGCVACAEMLRAEQRVRVRLFDLGSGACIRASSADMPPGPAGAALPQALSSMLLSRSSEPEQRVVVAAGLYDCRVFCWQVP